MRFFICALALLFGFTITANAQPAPAVSVTASTATMDALQDCFKKTTTEEMIACVVKSRLNIKPMHFYTGEYTRYSETDFGPRYDPRDWPYDKAAKDMCMKHAPEIKDPVIKFTQYNSVSGGCCGYGFFVMACVGIN
jgi:hypothetical protein